MEIFFSFEVEVLNFVCFDHVVNSQIRWFQNVSLQSDYLLWLCDDYIIFRKAWQILLRQLNGLTFAFFSW